MIKFFVSFFVSQNQYLSMSLHTEQSYWIKYSQTEALPCLQTLYSNVGPMELYKIGKSDY